ncbi:MAG: toxin-antitoxin system HicB family antitoxin [Dehalococcoidia bacterium]
MMNTHRKPLDFYLSLQYPFNVIADPDDGGYVIEFSDLPGCMTQVETLDELAAMAEEARTLWIETAYEDGQDIPLPSYPEEYSGKFVLRLPKALHRQLAVAADRDGVSLNQHIVALLAERDTLAQVSCRLMHIETQLNAIQSQLRYSVVGVPNETPRQSRGVQYRIADPVAA